MATEVPRDEAEHLTPPPSVSDSAAPLSLFVAVAAAKSAQEEPQGDHGERPADQQTEGDAREVQNRINAQSARQAGKPHDRFDEKDSTPNQRNQWIERGVLMVAGVLLGVVATFTLGGTLHFVHGLCNIGRSGSGGRIRTYDQAVNSRPLYH